MVKGKVACVTGADRGIGLELCKQLMDEGYTVFGGKYLHKWTFMEELQEKYPEQFHIVPLDVSSLDSVKAAGELIKAETDHVDILINNAAITGKRVEGRMTIFEDLDYDEMIKVYNVNTLGPIRVTNVLINLIMNSEEKLIVNISSEAGSIGTCWRPGGFNYLMSKAALNMSSAIIHNSIFPTMGGQVLDIHPGGMRSYFGTTEGPDDEVNAQGRVVESMEKRAKYIMDLLMDPGRFRFDHPAFVTYRGDRIPW